MCDRRYMLLVSFVVVVCGVLSGCTETTEEAPGDNVSTVDAGDDADTDAGSAPPGDGGTELDTGNGTSDPEDASSQDTSSPPSEDASTSDTSSEDTSSPSQPDTSVEDTGPTEPPEPDECGGNYWDDTHDGSNPWEDFDIDCDELSASWDCQATEAEEYILEMINQARQQEHVCGSTDYGPSQELEMDPQLRCAARLHSWDMEGRGYYDHDTPEGLSASGRVSIVPGPNHSAAENIYAWATTPENIFQGWMDSPGHCRNMLCESYQRVGIGVYEGQHTLKITGSGVCW